ncbi:plasmid pRiA4b ORF-3 family protein [Algivirga pacifica]|uniref:Plasmid pRiA4b Orf3-like domain-containing protein n=1 Tax=Algivirga pacifica TaxID=1162670 RepID=A0ABP9DH23_9BACT
MSAITYTNRKGKTSYIRQSTTKTGKITYYATTKVKKEEVKNMLTEMPEGYEFFENPETAVVKVRKQPTYTFTVEELKTIESILKKGKKSLLQISRDTDFIGFYHPMMSTFEWIQFSTNRQMSELSDSIVQYAQYEIVGRLLKKGKTYILQRQEKTSWATIEENDDLLSLTDKYKKELLNNQLSEIPVELPEVLPAVLDLKITLVGSSPSIYRTVKVNNDISLERLHDIIQIVMGWDRSHLYSFEYKKGKRSVEITQGGNPFWEDEPESEADEIDIKDYLTNKGDKLYYTYDFGDNWDHEILLVGSTEGAIKKIAECTEGKRACPPEDCGGIYYYNDYVKRQKKGLKHLSEDEIEWFGKRFDPEEFSLKEVNKRLSRSR